MSYLWSRPDSEGVQFCAVYDSDEIVSVRDFGTYAELGICNGHKGRPRFEHFASAQLAREADEHYLQDIGVAA